jgi:neutral trehalase
MNSTPKWVCAAAGAAGIRWRVPGELRARACAHTHYLHGELEATWYFYDSLLRTKSDSEQAQRLHALVRQATGQKHDKALEVVAVGGAVLLGVAGLALAFAAGGKGKK